jgi:N-acetylmuramoyl-L-alanine amidase
MAGEGKARQRDVALLVRLIRAEAEGERTPGMQLVGNVGINRTRANCLDFVVISTIQQMVFH